MLKLINYSEKSIAVIGDTKPHKDELKQCGGKFNNNLKCGPGWIFSSNRLNKLQDLMIQTGNSPEIQEAL